MPHTLAGSDALQLVRMSWGWTTIPGRQPDREAGAPVRRVADFQRTAVRIHDALDDSEPQPGTAAAASVCPPEALGNPVAHCRRYARAAILNAERRRRRDLDLDRRSLRRMLKAILDQIADRLTKSLTVSMHENRSGRAGHRDLLALPHGQRRQGCSDIDREGVKIRRFPGCYRKGLELRHREQLIDES